VNRRSLLLIFHMMTIRKPYHLLFAAWLGAGSVTRAAPPPDAAVLPPVEVVLERMLTNSVREAENDRQFVARYAYQRTKVQEERNPKGKVTKRTEKTINHQPPRPLAATSPVSGSADVPEAHELQPGSEAEHKRRPFEKRDFVLNRDLISRFEFALAERGSLAGRPAIVLDFQPAEQPPPARHFKDRFINKVAGRAWVDEADGFVVKVELHMTEPLEVVGGLVGVVKQCQYSFTRERTPEGLWFVKSVDWHLEGRQFLKRKSVDYHESRTNVVKVW